MQPRNASRSDEHHTVIGLHVHNFARETPSSCMFTSLTHHRKEYDAVYVGYHDCSLRILFVGTASDRTRISSGASAFVIGPSITCLFHEVKRSCRAGSAYMTSDCMNQVNSPRFSPMLQNADVQEATSSKKGPQRQSSSASGSQSEFAAASFQQFVCGSLVLYSITGMHATFCQRRARQKSRQASVRTYWACSHSSDVYTYVISSDQRCTRRNWRCDSNADDAENHHS